MLVHVLREYNINRILLSYLGCWPFQNRLARRLLPTFYLMVHISYIPFEIFTLYEYRRNGQIMIESCYQMVITCGFLVKLLNQLWNRDKIRHLYEIMENHWNIFTSDLEIRILKNYSAISQRFTKLYATITFSMMSMFIIIPSTIPMLLDFILPLNESRSRQLAVYAEFGIDQDKYFILIFCYTSLMIIVGISIMVAADTMHIACTSHACSLFQLIGQQIENITSNVGNEIKESDHSANTQLGVFTEEIMYQEYIICLKKHQLALEYVNILNDTHQIVGISFSLLLGAVYSLVGIRIVYVLDQLEEMIRYVFILTGATLQLTVLCYSGQKLMDESQNIFHRAYATEWYTFSPRLKSLVIIILYRSIVPCRLTAGNLFPLSMTIFASVVRTGVSYFTAFLSLKKD